MSEHPPSQPDWAQLQADLTPVALLGTGRRPLPGWPAELPNPAGGTAEERLLKLAALTRTAGLAGSPQVRSTPKPPAAPDRLTDPPTTASQLLDLLLTQSPVGRQLQPELVKEWLAQAVAAGCHVPARHLPAVIKLAQRETGLRDLVDAAGDERGRWLRGHARFRYSDSGTESEATAALTELRQTDPAQGLVWLESQWAEQSTDQRVSLLICLGRNLSMADEDFLERTLDDRSNRVSQQAQELLARLPSSRYAGRMRERLAAMVTGAPEPKRSALRSLASAVTKSKPPPITLGLPAADPAAVRDGLAGDRATATERKSSVESVLRGTPLDFWEAYGTPDQVATRLEESALGALADAAVNQQHAGWARALLSATSDRLEPLRVLPREEQLAFAQQFLTGPVSSDQFTALFTNLTCPWSLEVSRLMLAKSHYYGGRHLETGDFIRRVHPGLIGDLENLATKSSIDSSVIAALHHCARFLSLRDTIREAFK